MDLCDPVYQDEIGIGQIFWFISIIDGGNCQIHITHEIMLKLQIGINMIIFNFIKKVVKTYRILLHRRKDLHNNFASIFL